VHIPCIGTCFLQHYCNSAAKGKYAGDEYCLVQGIAADKLAMSDDKMLTVALPDMRGDAATDLLEAYVKEQVKEGGSLDPHMYGCTVYARHQGCSLYTHVRLGGMIDGLYGVMCDLRRHVRV
jgi:hypothetical protein